MPVSVAVGSFQKSGTNSGFPFNITHISGLAFQPKAIILTATATGGVAPFTNIMRPGMGWTAGSAQNYSVSWGSDDNVTTTNTFRRARNDHCLTIGSSGNAGTSCSIKLSAFESDGATFTYNLNDTGTYHIFWMAIGGTDITNVKAGEFNAATSTGNQDVNDVGFEPDVVFFMGGNSPNNPASSTSHLSMFLGTAASPSEEHVMSIGSDDNISPSIAARYQRTNRCIAFFADGDATTIDGEAEYVGTVSSGTGGFRVNWLNAPSSAEPVYYLAIKGGTWSAGTFNQPDTTTGNQSVTGLGYTPKGLLLYSTQTPTNANIVTHVKYALGAAASSTARWCVLGGDRNNVSTTQTVRGHLLTAVMRCNAIEADPAAGTDINSLADFVSFDSNTGFTVNWSTADAVQREMLYVTVGDSQGEALIRNVATEVINISEVSNKRQAKLRNIATETVQISDVRNRALGKVRIPGTESIQITEASNKTSGITEETVTAGNLILRFSGGASNQTTTDSLGGAMSAFAVTDNTLNNAWDDVTFAQSVAGLIEYRCYYIYNAHASLTAYNVEMWVDTTTPAGDSIEIARGSAAVSGTEQTVGSETTPPSAVSFSTAPDQESAINLDDIPAGGHRSIWLKRIVPAATPSWNDNSYTIRVSFASDHLVV